MPFIVPQPGPFPAPTPHPQPEPCTCGECGSCMEPLAHPKFSFGMLLEAKHLALEHRYHALRMDTHDIRLHEFGTVCGLRVDKHQSPDCVNKYVILRPGLALDCCGREIVVPSDLYVPLFDGAKSGWCGAPVSEPSQPALPTGTAAPPRTTLYIYLRYRQCDTDPIPSYVKHCGGGGCGGGCGGTCGGSCGCGGGCHESNCVLSITREGYEVSVNATPPPVWRNPVSTEFCRWLAVQLKGEGAGLVDASKYVGGSLQHALCEAITQPCPDTCGGGNDEVLLATATFNPDDTLKVIDNCTNRRLVVSTGAIFESLDCVVKALIACCGQHMQQLPKLGLTATVDPHTVDLSASSLSTTISYHAEATNSSPTDSAGPFTLQIVVDPKLTVKTATSTIGGTLVPVPTSPTTSAGTTVAVAGASLDKSAKATLAIDTEFPSAMKHDDTVTSTASITGYGGPSDGLVSLPTTFKGAVNVDGPRVVFGNLPTALSPSATLIRLREGIEVPFDRLVDTATTVALSAPGSPLNGTVALEITLDGDVGGSRSIPLPARLMWPSSGPPPTAPALSLAASDKTPQTSFQRLEKEIEASRVSVTLTLRGGSKGAAATPQTAIASPLPMRSRLDGDPPKGGLLGQPAGKSGDGTQGGNFTWSISVKP